MIDIKNTFQHYNIRRFSYKTRDKKMTWWKFLLVKGVGEILSKTYTITETWFLYKSTFIFKLGIMVVGVYM